MIGPMGATTGTMGNSVWPVRTGLVTGEDMCPDKRGMRADEWAQRGDRGAHVSGRPGQPIGRMGNVSGTTGNAVGRTGHAIGRLGQTMWPTRQSPRTDGPCLRTVGESHVTTRSMSSEVAAIPAEQRGVACDHETVTRIGAMDGRAASSNHLRPTTLQEDGPPRSRRPARWSARTSKE